MTKNHRGLGEIVNYLKLISSGEQMESCGCIYEPRKAINVLAGEWEDPKLLNKIR